MKTKVKINKRKLRDVITSVNEKKFCIKIEIEGDKSYICDSAAITEDRRVILMKNQDGPSICFPICFNNLDSDSLTICNAEGNEFALMPKLFIDHVRK